MKKATSIPKNIDEYLAAVPEPARGTLQKVRAAIRSAVPPVAFAAFSRHCSFFPMSYAVISAFKSDLKTFEVSKGTIRYPLDKPLPAALVKKMVKARIAENERRYERKKSR